MTLEMEFVNSWDVHESDCEQMVYEIDEIGIGGVVVEIQEQRIVDVDGGIGD